MVLPSRFLGIERFGDRVKTVGLFLVLVSPFFLGRI